MTDSNLVVNTENILVSVIILTYKRFEGIYETLNSIFLQRYDDLEIIISDDGSDNWDLYYENIENYINSNKRGNIKNVVISHLKENVGTTKNANSAIKIAKGKYIKLLTADDSFFNEFVIEQCVNYCEENCADILIGQSYVLRREGLVEDHVKDTILYRWQARGGRKCVLVPSDKDIEYLKSLDKEKCNRLIASRPIIHTLAVFYSNKLFNKTNGYIETYRLVEDMTYWPYLASIGIEFHFEKIIMAKYALNGMSNENHVNSEFFLSYAEIMRKIYIENEVRGGIFNKYLKKIRLKEIEHKENKVMHKKYFRMKFVDVYIYKLVMLTKYLLLGTRL